MYARTKVSNIKFIGVSKAETLFIIYRCGYLYLDQTTKLSEILSYAKLYSIHIFLDQLIFNLSFKDTLPQTHTQRYHIDAFAKY